MPLHHPVHPPEWWPANEPWPPRHPASRGRRWPRRFLWQMGGAMLLFWAIAWGSCGLLWWLVSAGGRPPLSWAGVVPWVLVGVAIAAFGMLSAGTRAVRRLASLFGDVVETIGRVEAGDYAARAREQGPREARTLARAVNALAERLQANDDQRRRLLADVTHELRTPLTVMQAQLEGLLDGVYPADAAHLAPLLEETHTLARLVEDLRTLALVESGALALHRESTDLAVLVGEVVAAFRASADVTGVELQVTLPDDLPLLEADPVRLKEVLANVLANALRHTPAGGRIAITGDVSVPYVQLRVSDTGTGIAPERLPHIFDRYYTSDQARGSGLGLAIAQNLVAAHGGRISATSQAGQGTVIQIELPLAANSQEFAP